jgi:hypothetical protein
MKRHPAKTPAAIDLDATLAGVAAMNVEQLRDLWHFDQPRLAARGRPISLL